MAGTVTIPEGVEVRVSPEQEVSSASAQVGDRFSIKVVDPVSINGVVVIPAGSKGTGEVTAAEKRGRLGKAGQLSVRALYVLVGDVRVALRGSKGAEGKGKVGTTVALTVLFGPLGLLKKGKDVTLSTTQAISSYVDQAATITVADAAPLVTSAPPVSEAPTSAAATPATGTPPPVTAVGTTPPPAAQPVSQQVGTPK